MTPFIIAASVLVGIFILCGWIIPSIVKSCIYNMPLSASFGFRRAAVESDSLIYVSNGLLDPIPVYWLGSTREQSIAVAKAMVSGQIPRVNYIDYADKPGLLMQSIRKKVDVWPTKEIRDLLGKPEDLYGEKPDPVIFIQ